MRQISLSRHSFLMMPLTLLACSKGEPAPLPDLGTLPELPLVDQDGRTRTLTGETGKILLVAFFFTRCPSICPRLIARMQEMERTLRKESIPASLAAITVDSEYDTPEVLKRYADARRIQSDSFRLLTGDSKKIAKAAEENFKIGLSGSFDPAKPDLGITHGSHVILIDARGHIRAFVRTFDEEAILQLRGYVNALKAHS